MNFGSIYGKEKKLKFVVALKCVQTDLSVHRLNVISDLEAVLFMR